VEIKAIANPRKEREQHYYHPAHTGLIELGLEPHLMSEEVLVAMLEKVRRYADHIDRSRILPRVRWNPDAPAACAAG
jgi:UDP-sulfoquinovose synthase